MIAKAEANQRKAQAIGSLYRERLDWIAQETRSQYAVRALDWIFGHPIFKASDFTASADIPTPTAARVVREQGLVREIRPPRGRRPAILAFVDLLNIAEGRTAF